jgi:enamine deaminase RidA (YjgF/YER057c/UK114 family)
VSSGASAVGNFQPAVRSGNLIFISGHISMRDGAVIGGKAGAESTIEYAYDAARTVADQLLETLERETGSLDRITRVVKLTGFVNAAPDFTDMSAVINGVSDRLIEALGARGAHARSAIGVASLPLGATVEAELIAELRE